MEIPFTCGAGFIGSASIRHIVQNTLDDAVNFDNLTFAGNLESLAEANDRKRYAFKQVDIIDCVE